MFVEWVNTGVIFKENFEDIQDPQFQKWFVNNSLVADSLSIISSILSNKKQLVVYFYGVP